MLSHNNNILQLPWLLDLDESNTSLIDTLDVNHKDSWKQLKKILSHRLDSVQSYKLHNQIDGLTDAQRSNLRLDRVKVCLTGPATFAHLGMNLKICALRHGIDLVAFFADFDQTAIMSLQPDAALIDFDPDFIFYYEASRIVQSTDSEAVSKAVAETTKRSHNLSAKYTAVAIVNTLVTPLNGVVSDADLLSTESTHNKVSRYNLALAENLQTSDAILFDLDHLAATVGYCNWSDLNFWYSAKLPFHPDCSDIFCDRFASILGASRGKSRRALVLDCDNTLWGGVIGDDGLEGIQIGQGSAGGEAHLDVQKTALTLKDRGVVLAVSSKNTDDIAMRAFQEHPDMLIKEDDVAIYRINWTDKAANISDIAKKLNLGLQSFVFLDDNPAERARVREALPEVFVPEIGNNAADYASLLLLSRYFNSVKISAEDRIRADMYRANTQRHEVMEALDDFEEYLNSLEMKISFRHFDKPGRPRIAQLISKSNQFNLTTHRYGASQIEQMETDSSKLHFQIRLSDRFGDNGMISVVIVDKAPADWTIDTWLMSCRVLGRRVEEITLSNIIDAANQEGAQRLIGIYKPTKKNAIVEHHFKKLGFSLMETNPNGETIWALNICDHQTKSLPFEIVT